MQHGHILKKIILYWGGHFWPQRHNSNKLGRGSQGDATYQMPCGFRQEKIFSCLPIKPT